MLLFPLHPAPSPEGKFYTEPLMAGLYPLSGVCVSVSVCVCVCVCLCLRVCVEGWRGLLEPHLLNARGSIRFPLLPSGP